MTISSELVANHAPFLVEECFDDPRDDNRRFRNNSDTRRSHPMIIRDQPRAGGARASWTRDSTAADGRMRPPMLILADRCRQHVRIKGLHMSSYRNQISCCVSDQVAADLSATAVRREITVAALVRQAIVRELYNRPVLIPEVHKYTLFIAFAVGELMRVHADAELHSRATNAWQDYLAEQERRHAD